MLNKKRYFRTGSGLPTRAGLALTSIVLPAHWISDVLAGLALGALTEAASTVPGYGPSANGV